MATVTFYDDTDVRFRLTYTITNTDTTWTWQLSKIEVYDYYYYDMEYTVAVYVGGSQIISKKVYSDDEKLKTWKAYTVSASKAVTKTHASQSVQVRVKADGSWVCHAGENNTYYAFTAPAKTSYTVSYSANGGSSTPSSQTKWYGEALTLRGSISRSTGAAVARSATFIASETGLSTTLYANQTTSYTFSGWRCSSNNTVYSAGGTLPANVNANVTMTAQWNSTNNPASVTLLGPQPLNGYVQTGWNTSSNGTGTQYSCYQVLTLSGNITLYATWKLADPTISVIRTNAQGASDELGGYAKFTITDAGFTGVSGDTLTISSASTPTVTKTGSQLSASTNTVIVGAGDVSLLYPDTSYTFTVSLKASTTRDTTTVTVTLPASDYTPPKINSVLALRVDNEQALSDAGEFVRLDVSWSIYDQSSSQTRPTSLTVSCTDGDGNIIDLSSYQPNSWSSIPSGTSGMYSFYFPELASGYEYFLTSDTTVNLAKVYYSLAGGSYTVVVLEPYYYEMSTDTELDPSKTYYERTGSGTASDPYEYTAAIELDPETFSDNTYFELRENNPHVNGYYERRAPIGMFSEKKSYVFKVTLADKTGLTRAAIATDTLSQAFFTLDMLGDSLLRYVVSSDESVIRSKSYYTRSGTGSAIDPYRYTLVDPAETEGYENCSPANESWYEQVGPRPGHGVAFGMPASEEGLHTGFPLMLHNIDGLDVQAKILNDVDHTGTFWEANNLVSDVRVLFGIGEGNINHGVWSQALDKWLIYADLAKTYLHGRTVELDSGSVYSSVLTLGNNSNLPAAISYYGPTRKGAMIKFIPNTVDSYGDGIVIGGGGSVVIGSGESADNFRTAASVGPGTEHTYLVSDGSIQFATNCNTIANRNIASLGTAGNFTCKQSISRISNNVADAKTVPLANAGVTGFYEYDGGNTRCGYSEVVRSTAGVYRSFAVENPKSSVTTAIYLYADDAAGSYNGHRYGFTDAAAFRAGLGLATIALTSTTVSQTSSAQTLASGSGASFSFTLSAPSGYTFAGIYDVQTNHNAACSLGRIRWSGSQATVYVTNRGSSSQSVTVTMSVKFLKETII